MIKKPDPSSRAYARDLRRILKAEDSSPYRFGMTLAILLSVLFAPTASHAENKNAGMFSGAYLQELCRSDEKGKEVVKGGHTACQAYIAGVIDYHKLLKSLGTQPLIDFCIPNTTPMKRLQNIVWVYLVKNPQHGEFLASPTVTMALFEYYPCPLPKKSKKR